MIKRILFLILGVMLLTGPNVFADDVSIDNSGNVKTGVSNTNAELEVTGGSGEGGIRGTTSGTGASGVYGINTTYGDYGILGHYGYGVYGYSSSWAGYFQGNTMVTGNLTVDGSIIGPVIGDITGVTAGTGLSGGGASGDVTLNANTTYLQRRVSSSCSVGSSIQAINEDGTVLCEPDDTGITIEADPEIGVNSLHYVPKWDGSALVSSSIYDNGNIGIGTMSPAGSLEVVKDQSPSIIRATNYNSASHYGVAVFSGRRARGTKDYPMAVQTDDYLSVFAGEGYGTSGFPSSPPVYRGRMVVMAAEDWTDTAQGTHIAFRTTPAGSNTDSEMLRITSAGNVGVGTTAPETKLHLVTEGSSYGNPLKIDKYSDNITSADIFSRKARGTSASPAAVQIGDDIGNFTVQGHNGYGFTNGAIMAFQVEGTPGAFIPTAIQFLTSEGSAQPVEHMRINHNGNIGIGATNPAEKLTVAGTIESTSGGIKFPDGTIQTTAATGEGTAAKKNLIEIALLKWYTNTVTSFAVGNDPGAIAFDGANIWVANFSDNNIMKLNAATGAVLGTYPVGLQPLAIAFDGANIWVANQGSANVTKLSAATGAVIGTYSVGNAPQGLAFDGAYIWVANLGNNTVTKLNAATGGVIGTYPVSDSPQGASRIAFDGAYIWVTNYYDNSVTKFNAATGGLMGTYYANPGPVGIAFDGSYIWVVSNASTRISKINPDTGGVVDTYPVQGNNIAFDGVNIWVTSSFYNHITKLKAATGEVIGTYTVGDGPNGIAFDGANIWVTNQYSDTISKL